MPQSRKRKEVDFGGWGRSVCAETYLKSGGNTTAVGVHV